MNYMCLINRMLLISFNIIYMDFISKLFGSFYCCYQNIGDLNAFLEVMKIDLLNIDNISEN